MAKKKRVQITVEHNTCIAQEVGGERKIAIWSDLASYTCACKFSKREFIQKGEMTFRLLNIPNIDGIRPEGKNYAQWWANWTNTALVWNMLARKNLVEIRLLVQDILWIKLGMTVQACRQKIRQAGGQHGPRTTLWGSLWFSTRRAKSWGTWLPL